jgi:DNA-directed RNA polymerase subunit D
MQFENVQVNSLKTRCTFRLSPIHVAYANTLRRIIMTGVEMIGFRAEMTSKGTTTDVSVKKNDTPMTNEMLAHRIGLLPIHVKNPIEFESEKYTFSLSVSANADTVRQVTCADFTVTKERGEGLEPDVLDPLEFFKPHPITKDTCLIATLPPGAAKIELTATPSKGTGREHARFQPTSLCAYTYTKDTDEEKIKAHFDSWLREAKKIEGLSEESDKPKYDMYMREFNTMEAARVFVTDEAGNPNSFDFSLESIGVLDIPYIVARACDIGIAMVGKYVSLGTTTDPKAFPEDLEIVPTRSRIIGAFDFLLKGHDHTLGNLLQTWLSEHNMSTAVTVPAAPVTTVAGEPSVATVATVATAAPGAEEEEGAQAGGARSSGRIPITYVGYEIPHPLRDEMVLRIAVESGKQMDAQMAFAQACSGCADIFKEMRNAWNSIVNPGVVAAAAALKSAVSSGTLKRKPITKVATAATTAAAPVANIETIRSALKSAVAPVAPVAAAPTTEPPKATVNLEAARSALAAAAAPAPAPAPTATKSAVLRRKK